MLARWTACALFGLASPQVCMRDVSKLNEADATPGKVVNVNFHAPRWFWLSYLALSALVVLVLCQRNIATVQVDNRLIKIGVPLGDASLMWPGLNPPKPHQLHVVEAWEAASWRREFNWTKRTTTTSTTTWPRGVKRESELEPFIEMFNSKLLPVNLSRCALVGSSAILLNRSLGEEIDGHSAVIRVNRIPRKATWSDMGRKTDILFGNCRAWYDLKEGKSMVPTLGGKRMHCTSQSFCPKTWVLKQCQNRNGAFKFEPEELKRLWGTPIGQMNLPVLTAADRSARAWDPNSGAAPMTGVYAFFTFAPLCESLTVYGFGGGKASIDGVHFHRPGLHSTDRDNDLLDGLLSRKYEIASECRSRKTSSCQWLKRWVPELQKHTRILRG
mmetsp:Transcript_26514/g.61880  ORF Transcript_26514/g.61880 Transcript_26514/m.61880 type:complete len:386 (+) Transcript_26514:79-1236(+)